MKKVLKTEKLKYSLATYREKGELICDLEELAEQLQFLGNVPEKLNLTKATEITLLAKYALMKLAEE